MTSRIARTANLSRRSFGFVLGCFASTVLWGSVVWAESREVVAFGDSLTDMGNRMVETRKPDLKFKLDWVAQLAGPSMLNAAEIKPSGMSFFYGGPTTLWVALPRSTRRRTAATATRDKTSPNG
ncbi:hypothetical protein [Verrucomicrobium spinosum]|uniref:hypothetical protein n=1 Tax=Verrucomicrobium spinosum TaxID=2736 RepID=UPI0001744E03|nr:hypothetical protein [Verrucomicrobium spinosum]